MTDRPKTFGDLKASGYQTVSVKAEMRRNLLAKLRNKETIFPGIIGYEDSVFPQIQNAILSRHDMLFLGLRGQGKTRMLRMLVNLLDDVLPIVAGSEINDDPFAPISKYAKDLIIDKGNDCPIEWVGRDRRYQEKLATPDVTIAGRRNVYFDGRTATDTAVFERAALATGAAFAGPAIVEQFDATTLVPPGWRAKVDPYRNLVLEREQDSDG